MRLLVIEDNFKMADVLRRGLELAGYAVDVVAEGEAGLAQAGRFGYDAIVLDLGLPDIDGFTVCQQLRLKEIWAPVLILTALGDAEQRIKGLDAGADDYLVKPFVFGELLSRLRALMRRGRPARPTVLRCGDLVLDPATRRVEWQGNAIELSSREYDLLLYFMHHPGDVIQRSAIRQHVWGGQIDGHSSNIIDSYVKMLRDKIDRRFGIEMFETVRGVGYRLQSDRP